MRCVCCIRETEGGFILCLYSYLSLSLSTFVFSLKPFRTMRPIYRLPVIVHEGVRGRRASPRGSPRLGRRSSPRTSPNLRRRSQADSRSRSASPANIPALKVRSCRDRERKSTGVVRRLSLEKERRGASGRDRLAFTLSLLCVS